MTDIVSETVSRDFAKFNPVRFAIFFVAFIVWATIMPLLFCLCRLAPGFKPEGMIICFHGIMCRIIGLRVQFKGEVTKHKPTLFLSNHVSYLDIFALGQNLPGWFVAKSEIGSWPVINKLARLQNTIFIERKASKARQHINILSKHLQAGTNLILFPEGTSTNGAEVKPFKSSLLAAASAENIMIQPVTIVYTRYAGEGMNQATRDNFAWYADMPFGSHFVRVLGLKRLDAIVQFHQPVQLSDFSDRKACAEHCTDVVSKSLENELRNSGSTDQ